MGHLIPSWLRDAVGTGTWLLVTPAANLLLINVKPAFSGHCVIFFTACLWGALDQFSPTVYFFLSVVLGYILKLHGLLMSATCP